MATYGDYIRAALQDLGVLDAVEVGDADDLEKGRAELNGLIGQWSAENLNIYSEARTTWSIVPLQASYTVGVGGNVNIARPQFIRQVNFQDTAQNPILEYQLGDLLTDEAWGRIELKDQTSPLPTAAYYNPTFPLGTLSFWQIPTSPTLQGVMYSKTAITSVAAITDTVSLPPQYERFIVKNLAVELAPGFKVSASPELIQQAINSMTILKRSNVRMADIGFDAGALLESGSGGSYDIRSDTGG